MGLSVTEYRDDQREQNPPGSGLNETYQHTVKELPKVKMSILVKELNTFYLNDYCTFKEIFCDFKLMDPGLSPGDRSTV